MEVSARILKKDNILSEGGEAIIYNYDSSSVIKVFKDNIDLIVKRNKISKLIAANIKSKNIIAPTEMINDNNKNFIGYKMNKINGEEFRRLGSKKYLKLNNIKIKDIVKMLVKIQDIMDDLHSKNIIIGDLNDSNILFDDKFNVYFIDVDSWKIENCPCNVCMESFQDPLLEGNNFTKETDYYAFAILVFKSLTMLHPFGGTTDPEMDLLQRMQKKISVIDNDSITIPKAFCKGWKFMPPELLKNLLKIFNKGERINLKESLMDFANNLTLCNKHGDHYYSNYSECPICNSKVSLKPKVKAPTKAKNASNIPCAKIKIPLGIKMILDQNVVVDKNNCVRFKGLKNGYKYNNNHRYYKSGGGTIVSTKEKILVDNTARFEIDKKAGSRIVAKDDCIYFIDLNNKLIQLTFHANGNVMNVINDVSSSHYYEVYDKDHYIIFNNYNYIKIICVDGFNFELKSNYNIVNYGMHFDALNQNWLLILEDSSAKFHTYIFNKNNLVFNNDTYRYNCNLGDICFYNNTAYVPKDGYIRGFNLVKNTVKDFQCVAVNESSNLTKVGSQFMIINDTEIYLLG